MPLDPIPILDEISARLAALDDPTALEVYETLLPYENVQRAAVAAWLALGGGSGLALAPLGQAGDLQVGTGTGRFVFPRPGTLVSVVAVVFTAPTGDDLVVDVNLNDVSIFPSSPKPTILAGENVTADEFVPDVTEFAALDYISGDVDQIGSGAPGSALFINVLYRLSS